MLKLPPLAGITLTVTFLINPSTKIEKKKKKKNYFLSNAFFHCLPEQNHSVPYRINIAHPYLTLTRLLGVVML